MRELSAHNRRSIRLKEYDYSAASYYFITICSADRAEIFGGVKGGSAVLNAFGETVKTVWISVVEKYNEVILDEFIIMPNHLHCVVGIISTGDVGAIHELPPADRRQMLIPKVIGYFKMVSAKEINIIRGVSGQKVWQRNYYESVIRSEKQLSAIREYIISNPANWDKDPDRVQE